MSGAMSKRQQVRNEKTLQELVQNVPGNNQCADCHARNPSWASWSLGVFLCMRCAAIHRKLGTHISKVKSLSMDSWSNEQVDNMRKVGNVVSNQIYNPENKRAPVPIDADEVDSAMERFIRQKYTNNVASKPGKSNSPRFDEGIPPPLPPKNSTKFGFKSAVSLFPSRAKKDAKMAAAMDARRSPPNKASRVFGSSVGHDGPHDGLDDLDAKLAQLRDMGFQNSQRNVTVLKGFNGNLEQAVETLIRLGEGDSRRNPGIAAPSRESTLRTTRSLTPMSSSSNSAGLSLGLSVPQKQDRPMTPSSGSTNPFDAMPPAQPQTAQSTGTLQNKNPYHSSTNPWGAPTQQPDALGQALQGLNISPAQPLFPHHTGGPATQVSSQPVQYQQSPVPPMPTAPQAYQQMGFQSFGSMTYPQPVMQHQQPTGYNPFFSSNPSSPLQQQMPQQNLSISTSQPQAQGAWANNPFARSPTRISSPTALGQIPEQGQTSFQSPQLLQQQQPQQQQQQAIGTNPFFSSPMQTPTQMMPQAYGQQQFNQQYFGQQQFGQQPQQQQQQQQYFPVQRADKAAIMALYGQPQPTNSLASVSETAQLGQQPPPPAPEDQIRQLQRAQTAPVAAQHSAANSRNPFLNGGGGTAQAASTDPFTTGRHISRESMNLGMDLAWANGRHSPDAFASLSARHG